MSVARPAHRTQTDRERARVPLSWGVRRGRVVRVGRLGLGGFDGDERLRIRGPAPAKPYEIEVGWYVARKPGM